MKRPSIAGSEGEDPPEIDEKRAKIGGFVQKEVGLIPSSSSEEYKADAPAPELFEDPPEIDEKRAKTGGFAQKEVGSRPSSSSEEYKAAAPAPAPVDDPPEFEEKRAKTGGFAQEEVGSIPSSSSEEYKVAAAPVPELVEDPVEIEEKRTMTCGFAQEEVGSLPSSSSEEYKAAAAPAPELFEDPPEIEEKRAKTGGFVQKEVGSRPSSSSEEDKAAAPAPAPELGEDLVFEILKRADARTLAASACVSRRWRSLSEDERLWEAVCTRHWANIGCGNLQLRSVVLALGGFRRLHSLYLLPLLRPTSAAGRPRPALPLAVLSAPRRPSGVPARWGKDEVQLSLSLLSIGYFERMNLSYPRPGGGDSGGAADGV